MAKHQKRASDIAFPPKGIRKPKTFMSEGEESYVDRFAARGTRFFHNGRMRGGVKGATKAAMIGWLQNESPHLLDSEGNVDLGSLPVDRRLTWRDSRRLVVRCVEYGFAREAFMRALAAGGGD